MLVLESYPHFEVGRQIFGKHAETEFFCAYLVKFKAFLTSFTRNTTHRDRPHLDEFHSLKVSTVEFSALKPNCLGDKFTLTHIAQRVYLDEFSLFRMCQAHRVVSMQTATPCLVELCWSVTASLPFSCKKNYPPSVELAIAEILSGPRAIIFFHVVFHGEKRTFHSTFYAVLINPYGLFMG